MEAPKLQVLVLGHSVIGCLERKLQSGHNHTMQRNFGLRQRDSFCMASGWSVSNLQLFKDQAKRVIHLSINYRAAVIQIGGNDLSD